MIHLIDFRPCRDTCPSPNGGMRYKLTSATFSSRPVSTGSFLFALSSCCLLPLLFPLCHYHTHISEKDVIFTTTLQYKRTTLQIKLLHAVSQQLSSYKVHLSALVADVMTQLWQSLLYENMDTDAHEKLCHDHVTPIQASSGELLMISIFWEQPQLYVRSGQSPGQILSKK